MPAHCRVLDVLLHWFILPVVCADSHLFYWSIDQSIDELIDWSDSDEVG